MGKTALLYSTFQAPHMGHVEDIQHITQDHDVSDVVFGIGSSKQHHLFTHPFTLAERKEMISLMIQDELSNVLSTTPQMHGIPDTWDIDETYEYIKNNLPPFDVVVTNNSEVKEMCAKYKIECISIPRAKKVYGEVVRHQIALDNKPMLEKNLSPSVNKYIHEINAQERMMAAALRERIQPKLAVDVVHMDKDGYVTMIERRDDPVGLAFPGGMIEYGDTIAKTARKEAEEEINLDVEVVGVNACIDAVYRDPRWHTYTFPVYVTAEGTPVAGDDAKEAFKIHIDELYQRRHECVLGGDKIVEQLHAKRVFEQTGSV